MAEPPLDKSRVTGVAPIRDRRPRRKAVVMVALLLLAAFATATRAEPVVAVAASLRVAMPALARAFTAETGDRVRIAYGSSGQLTRQIRRGAPFQLFVAANSAYPRKLIDAGLTVDEGAVYAHGRIGLFVPNGSALAADGRLRDLRRKVDSNRIERFAIANPQHAPYGVRARQALEHAGLWAALQPLLILGENASQAAQFAASSSADGGIVPASLATAPRFARRGRFALIPASWHQPLAQRAVLLRDAGPIARAFYRFLRQPAARAILEEHGFQVPTGEVAS